MIAGNEVGGRKLLEMMEDHGLSDLEGLSAAIVARSEQSMREAIRAIPDGTYRHQIDMDGFDEPIVVKLAITISGDCLTADYTGTSPQSGRGINVVYSYCHAYTTYPIKCSVSPEVPNNEGSFRPITVTAPEGSILNCRRPAPVGARHILGHFLSAAVFGALSHVIPDRVVAEGSQGLWNTQFDGIDERGEPSAMSSSPPGAPAPVRTRTASRPPPFPAAFTESPWKWWKTFPPVHRAPRAHPGHRRPGKFRGGLGQRMVLKVRGGTSLPAFSHVRPHPFPGQGVRRRADGAKGRIYLDDGTVPHSKTKYILKPAQRVTLELPGGGGFYRPEERAPELVREDVIDGLVSLTQAREVYRVALVPATLEVDTQTTEKLRSGI